MKGALYTTAEVARRLDGSAPANIALRVATGVIDGMDDRRGDSIWCAAVTRTTTAERAAKYVKRLRAHVRPVGSSERNDPSNVNGVTGLATTDAADWPLINRLRRIRDERTRSEARN